jgi:hypothetical protein
VLDERVILADQPVPVLGGDGREAICDLDRNGERKISRCLPESSDIVEAGAGRLGAATCPS